MAQPEELRDGEPVGIDAALEPLRKLLASACVAFGPRSADPFRGMYLGEQDVAEALARSTHPAYASATAAADVAAGFRSWPGGRLLVSLLDLDEFEQAVVALALAPEVDPRFGTALAWLQDDLTRRRPSSWLALQLLCPDVQLLDDCRVALSGGGPLFALRVLVTQPAEVPLPTQVLILDEQIRRLLLGEPGLDSRLAGWCRLGRPSATDNLPEPLGTALRVGRVVPGDDTIRLTLGGRRGLGQGSVAGAIAALTGRSVLEVDLDAARSFGPARARDLFAVLVREAALQDAVLDLVPAEALADESWLPRLVGDAVERAGVSTVLRNRGSGPARRLEGIPMISVDLILPGPNERRTLWAAAAHHQGLRLDDSDLDVLAQRYRLAGADIRAAVARAVAASRLGLASSQPAAACAAQARTTGGDRLAELATRIEPRFGWADLVLQTATTDQLHELCARVAVHAEVLADWGFARKLSLGRGLAALFAGPSGTGKSMAAEVVAGQLGLDLYRVDLATVVDKYIGETEKNLDAVFRAAEDANGILLFDEADALFGRRSEVRDAHDRYANLEISYLLQRIEQYDGTAILSTNLHANLDDAFLRRLTAIIWFPFPDAGQRAELWRRTWPAELPLAELDYIDLASRFPLCGGNIKAAALAAAGLARADGGVVTSHHVRHAVAREYEKLGRTLTAEELGAPAVAP